MTKLTVKDVIELIDKELEWCKSEEAQRITITEEYKSGFVAGLSLVKLFIDKATEALKDGGA